MPLSSNSQLRTHYWNKHSYATSAAGPSSSRCSNVEETAQLRRVRGRVEDTYRYKNRTCRCRLGLTHLLSAWFSLGVRSQTDRGKTDDGDATSIHPCSMYGEPSQVVLWIKQFSQGIACVLSLRLMCAQHLPPAVLDSYLSPYLGHRDISPPLRAVSELLVLLPALSPPRLFLLSVPPLLYCIVLYCSLLILHSLLGAKSG